MKFKPVMSRSPQRLVRRDLPTETADRVVRLETYYDPVARCRFLSIGVGGGRSARLNHGQALRLADACAAAAKAVGFVPLRDAMEDALDYLSSAA